MGRYFSVVSIAVLLAMEVPALGVAGHGSDLFGLARVQSDMHSRRVSSYDRSGGNNDRFEHIQDGQTRELFNVKGAGIINHIWITIAPPPEHLNRNDIILRMYWDGNEFPSVESPIGPFFGQGWNESYPFVSLPLAVGPVEGRALVSYFVMPFAKGARIEIENQTGREISAFYYYVDYAEVDALPDDMGRFCAWYNHELTEARAEGENEWGVVGPQGKNPDGKKNYLFVDIKGKGHFVGVNYYVHCPTPMWYGEGDDMFFINGDKMPTLHGTGTEDYFNTSWCPKTLYTHPYFGYARVNDDIGWMGRTHVYRFHISDPIYFDKSLRFTIEHGHEDNLTLDLASVAYWYQAPPLNKLAPIPDKEARKPKAFIGVTDLHRWRHEWRKSQGGDDQLWGNER
jgi:D-arabinan exo alpha-(1,3)/(1,5)-arabinofuranosidase (non-reducing end)